MPKHKLSLKQKVFIDKTIETLNPTEGAMEAYDVKDRSVARSIASENLTKPYIREEILKTMERKGLDLDTITEIHKRNITQDINIPASNTALDMLYNLSEAYPAQRTINTNINVDIGPEQIKQRKEALEEELNRIRQ